MFAVGRHVTAQVLFPEKAFATNVAMEVLIPYMLDYMLPKDIIVEELNVTVWTHYVLLFQMRSFYMTPHE